ncbi:MAG: hypothetical protein V2A69_06440, partial [Pseudomonadota bacterium]
MAKIRTGFDSDSLLSTRGRKSFRFRFRLLGSIVISLLISGLILGVVTARLLRDIISEDFNQQQLILARHTARMVDQNIQFLKKELISLSFSPSLTEFCQSKENRMKTALENRMNIALETVKNSSVISIALLDSFGNLLKVVGEERYLPLKTTPRKEPAFFQWCLLPGNQHRVFLSQFEPNKDPKDNHLYMIMATPVGTYQKEASRENPAIRPLGVIAFLIDSTKFLERFTKDIHSGKTGYAWVIDNNGNFVIHIEKDFIGGNAFLVRQARDPSINFIAVNTLQKEAMLKGEEGIGWYYSGWHRGEIGKMKKLVAFTPIHLSDE